MQFIRHFHASLLHYTNIGVLIKGAEIMSVHITSGKQIHHMDVLDFTVRQVLVNCDCSIIKLSNLTSDFFMTLLIIALQGSIIMDAHYRPFSGIL